MNTLLLQLSGPMQSWGTQSRFDVRDTGLEPSKSGVIGLVCAALGRPRDASVDDLAVLRMGVRVDREGVVSRDFQTAGGTRHAESRYGVYISDGSAKPRAVVSQRYFLSDAVFLVGLESHDLDLLRLIDSALAAPVWPLYLGRKSYPPSAPVAVPDGIRIGESLEDVLGSWAPVAPSRPRTAAAAGHRLVIEQGGHESGEVRQDQPIGAAFLTRRFAPRRVETTFVSLPEVTS